MSMRKLRIVNSSPQHNEKDVSVNTEISLDFSEAMDRKSILNEESIVLKKGSKVVPSTYEYVGEFNKSTLILKPLKELLPGVTYELIVRSGDKGPMSNPMLDINGPKKFNSEHNYYFTTASKEKEEVPPEETTPGGDKETPPVEDNTPPEEVPGGKEDDTGVIFDPLEEEVNNLRLESSYPEYGDLVDLKPEMVLIFNKKVNTEKLNQNIFIKEASINSLLEKINKDKLIKGLITAEDKSTEAKEFVFKPEKALLPGKEYQLVIKEPVHEELKHDIRINFQTLFERMFADVDTVRLVLGAFSERLTDLDLAKLINQQSNSIYQLASMMDSFNESDWAQENGVIVTFPYAASQYVVYSTAYYAILGRSLEGSSGMSESIKLADLSVSGSSESSDNLSDLLELLKAEFERWWDVLQGKPEVIEEGVPNPNYSMTIATRGGDEAPYPDFQTRVPFSELGGSDT